jgi:hypothetical protein
VWLLVEFHLSKGLPSEAELELSELLVKGVVREVDRRRYGRDGSNRAELTLSIDPLTAIRFASCTGEVIFSMFFKICLAEWLSGCELSERLMSLSLIRVKYGACLPKPYGDPVARRDILADEPPNMVRPS